MLFETFVKKNTPKIQNFSHFPMQHFTFNYDFGKPAKKAQKWTCQMAGP